MYYFHLTNATLNIFITLAFFPSVNYDTLCCMTIVFTFLRNCLHLSRGLAAQGFLLLIPILSTFLM